MDYKICSRCIMDTTDPDIEFDDHGICSNCRAYDERVKKELYANNTREKNLKGMVEEIKKTQRGNEYDCIIGVSGGVDSTMVAYLAKKRLGLNPLAVHLDNGWDSELAVKNIERALKKLDIDLFTYVLDWEEFKDLQISFLKSSFINAEIPTDHAIFAALFDTAIKYNIRYILGGSNIVTEGILPSSWVYDYRDWKLIKGIHKRFGQRELNNFPHFNIAKMIYYIFIKNIKYIPILNFIEYNKVNAMNIIKDELGWRYYGGKHYESIYTRFYQGYILPVKYNVDKRKAHLSTLIASGQISREEALAMLKEPAYLEEQIKEDKEYVIKKFCLKDDEFEEIMSLPIKHFKEYPNWSYLFSKLSFFVKLAKKVATKNSRSFG